MNRSSLMRALTLAALVAAYVGAAQWALAANSFFNASGTPAQGSALSSAAMRAEFAAIGAGFDKLPALTANTAIVVNGTGTALTNTVGALALAGNFTTTGAFNTTFVQQASISLTLPLTADTLLGRATTDTLTNKSISGSTNTITNIGNAALTNSSFTLGSTGVSLGGTATTLAGLTLTTPTISQIINTGTLTLPISTDTLVGKATTDIFTNKTFDTAGTGNVFKINGTAISDKTGTGKAVLDNAPTLTNPIVGTQSAADNSTKAASTAYVDANFANGTWVPSDQSGASLTFTSVSVAYTRIGNIVFVYGTITFPSTASGALTRIGGLPFPVPNQAYAGPPSALTSSGAGSSPAYARPVPNTSAFAIVSTQGVTITNATESTQTLIFSFMYPIN